MGTMAVDNGRDVRDCCRGRMCSPTRQTGLRLIVQNFSSRPWSSAYNELAHYKSAAWASSLVHRAGANGNEAWGRPRVVPLYRPVNLLVRLPRYYLGRRNTQTAHT
jgi:hypothetical protein